jgi:drug/metabolite transporter (DMT)-like permease
VTRARLDSRTVAALTITLLFWGSAFPFIRIALRAYHPAHLTLLRFVTASAAMLAYAVVARIGLPRPAEWAPLFGVGFLSVAAYHTMLNYGLVSVGAGAGSLIVNTAPVFASVFANRFLGEPVDARTWVGLAVSLTGTALIALGSSADMRLTPAAGLLVGCAVTWGLSMVAMKPLVLRHSPLQVAMASVWTGTLMLVVFAPGLPAAIASAPAAATWSIVYLGVFPIAVSYATWGYTLSKLPATRVAGYTYTIPVIALVVAFLMLGERPGPLALVGGVVALAGVGLANAGRRNTTP